MEAISMITFDYIQKLSALSKEELEKRINEMPDAEARELLFGLLCSMFRHDRVSINEIGKYL